MLILNKDVSNSSLNSHVFWDTQYINIIQRRRYIGWWRFLKLSLRIEGGGEKGRGEALLVHFPSLLSYKLMQKIWYYMLAILHQVEGDGLQFFCKSFKFWRTKTCILYFKIKKHFLCFSFVSSYSIDGSYVRVNVMKKKIRFVHWYIRHFRLNSPPPPTPIYSLFI